jgi:hypothetical protein
VISLQKRPRESSHAGHRHRVNRIRRADVRHIRVQSRGDAQQLAGQSQDDNERRRQNSQAIFRFDTFGDEQLWTDVLRMHEVIATVDPATALAVGVKVDLEALQRMIVAALRARARLISPSPPNCYG